MAGSKSNYLENVVLNHFLKGSATSAPSNVYLGILSAVDTSAETQTEIAPASYTATSLGSTVVAGRRPEICFGTVSSGCVFGPTVDIEFENGSGSAFDVVGFGIYDCQCTSGSPNLLYYGDISCKTIEDGDSIRFEATCAIRVSES